MFEFDLSLPVLKFNVTPWLEPPVDHVERLMDEAVAPSQNTCIMRVLHELAGIAFLREWDGDKDQVAWNECTDPFAMLKAVAETANTNAARIAMHAIGRFASETVELLAAMDPLDRPEAELRLQSMERMREDPSALKIAEHALAQRRAVDREASRSFAKWIRHYIPPAPLGFSAAPLPDPELVRRLQVCGEELPPMERQWVGGLNARIKLEGKLAQPQRARATRLLRQVGSWKLY